MKINMSHSDNGKITTTVDNSLSAADVHIDREIKTVDGPKRRVTSTDLSATSNTTCKRPKDIPNLQKQPRTYAAAHPELQSKPTPSIPSPGFKRRKAAADEDLKRRLAIEAAMVNLGHSYDEAVTLVARLKELGMDLGAFIKNTCQAKERSSRGGGQRQQERGALGRRSMLQELGGLSINRGSGDDEVKDEIAGGQVHEGEGENEREEWRIWCE